MVLGTFVFAGSAWGGPRSDGGGKTVVCRDENGKIKSAELLDLWEARLQYKRKLLKDNRPMEAQIKDAALRFSQSGIVNGMAEVMPTYSLDLFKSRNKLRGVHLTLTVTTAIGTVDAIKTF